MRDGRKVRERVVAEIVEDLRRCHHRDQRRHHQRQAIRRRGLEQVHRDPAVGARTVLHGYRLAQRDAHPVGHQPRHRVQAGAGREADQEPDGLFLRRCGQRAREHEEKR